jgi:hypothetical protein
MKKSLKIVKSEISSKQQSSAYKSWPPHGGLLLGLGDKFPNHRYFRSSFKLEFSSHSADILGARLRCGGRGYRTFSSQKIAKVNSEI